MPQQMAILLYLTKPSFLSLHIIHCIRRTFTAYLDKVLCSLL